MGYLDRCAVIMSLKHVVVFSGRITFCGPQPVITAATCYDVAQRRQLWRLLRSLEGP
jgi:hypothetical protein